MQSEKDSEEQIDQLNDLDLAPLLEKIKEQGENQQSQTESLQNMLKQMLAGKQGEKKQIDLDKEIQHIRETMQKVSNRQKEQEIHQQRLKEILSINESNYKQYVQDVPKSKTKVTEESENVKVFIQGQKIKLEELETKR